MKTYDEIYENVIEATNAHRQKVRKIQNTVSATAVFLTCILGVGKFMELEKPESRPSVTDTTTTTTMTTDEMTQIVDTVASAPASSDMSEPPTTISYRGPAELAYETTAEPYESEFSVIYSDGPKSTTTVISEVLDAFFPTEPAVSDPNDQENPPAETSSKPPETLPASTTTEAPEKTTPSTTATTPAATKATPSLEGATFPPTEPEETEDPILPEPSLPATESTDVLYEPTTEPEEPTPEEPFEPTESSAGSSMAEPSEYTTEAETTTEETTTTTKLPLEAEETTTENIYFTPEEWKALFGDLEYQLIERDAFIEVTWTTITTIVEEFFEEFEDCSEIS